MDRSFIVEMLMLFVHVMCMKSCLYGEGDDKIMNKVGCVCGHGVLLQMCCLVVDKSGREYNRYKESWV